MKENLSGDYTALAGRMSELASQSPGYIAHKTFAAEDGERVTIVEFESEEDLHIWRLNPEHVKAKRLGYRHFYKRFQYQICRVLSSRTWQDDDSVSAARG